MSQSNQFFRYLVELCNIRSVHTEPENVKNAIRYCESVFQKNLKTHFIIRDGLNNLICMPKSWDPSLNIVYLSAHVDTVTANPEEWTPPFSPFIPFEDEKQIVARGVSDCKAGVAFQLLLSSLHTRNTVFTLTFKEEGSGEKTAHEIAKHIRLSNRLDYLIVLENTVIVAPEPVLEYYTLERGNFTIQVEGTITKLKRLLSQLNDWNPIYIVPTKTKWNNKRVITQAGGHACTTDRNNNLLTTTILAADHNALIQTSGEVDIAVIPTKIYVGNKEKEVTHSLILNIRSCSSKDHILHQLKDIEYVPLKLAPGINVQKIFCSSPLYALMHQIVMKTKEGCNPGSSDASHIYSALDCKEGLLPVVIGPGTRSQKHLSPPRLTHGVNETFDKASGMSAVQSLLQLLRLTGHLLS